MEQEDQKYHFEAALHGIDLQASMKKAGTIEKGKKKMEETKYPELPKKEGEIDLPMKFEAPEKYNALSDEEKEELTKKMMAAHRKFIREQGILPEKGT